MLVGSLVKCFIQTLKRDVKAFLSRLLLPLSQMKGEIKDNYRKKSFWGNTKRERERVPGGR